MGSYRETRVAYCLERLGWASSGAAGVALHQQGLWGGVFYIVLGILLGGVAKYLTLERGFFG